MKKLIPSKEKSFNLCLKTAEKHNLNFSEFHKKIVLGTIKKENMSVIREVLKPRPP
jgi:hypothetical protein